MNQVVQAGDWHPESVELDRLDIWSFASLVVWMMVLDGKLGILYARVAPHPSPSDLSCHGVLAVVPCLLSPSFQGTNEDLTTL